MKLSKNKKGVEITFNAIIIAILVLIVLVVVILILTGVFSDIVPQLSFFMSCDGREGGHCEQSCDEGEHKIYKYGGCGKDKYDGLDYCCIPKG